MRKAVKVASLQVLGVRGGRTSDMWMMSACLDLGSDIVYYDSMIAGGFCWSFGEGWVTFYLRIFSL